MRINKYVEGLRAKSATELDEELVAAKKELLNLRFQSVISQLDSTSKIAEVRKNIAKVQTVIVEKSKIVQFVNRILYRKENSSRGKKSKKNTYK